MRLRNFCLKVPVSGLLVYFCLFSVSHAEQMAPSDNSKVNIFYQELVQINHEAEKKLKLAFDLINQSNFEEALDVLKKINASAPFYGKAYTVQIKLYQSLGRQQEALKVLETAGKTIANFDLIFKSLDISKFPPAFSKPDSAIYIAPFKDDQKAAISFNFDDGPRSVYTQALPIMDEFGYKATILVNPSVVTDTFTNIAWGSWEEWRDADKRGYEIGNHGYRHHDLTKEEPKEWEYDINESYNVIKEKIGVAPLSFVFPHDKFNNQLIDKVKERHDVIRTYDYLSKVYPGIFIAVYGGELFSLETANKIIDFAVERNYWVVAECHAIYSDDLKTFKPMTKEFFRNHLSYLKTQDDKIWVDTFINVYSYLDERRFSEIEATPMTNNSVTIKIKTTLNPENIHIPLTVVVDLAPSIPKQVSIVEQDKHTEKRSFKIINSRILIDILPGSNPVTVQWSL